MQRVPPLESPHVQAFCSEVASTSKPQLVMCRPSYGHPANECFPIVEEQIASRGGSMVTGWAIWEWPGVFIEAEFHAVWASQTGELLDLSPRPFLASSIVFLPDPSTQYEGRQIDNVRKPLVRDNDLIRFLFIFRRRFEILNEGDLAFQHGMVPLSPRAAKELHSLQKEGLRLERRLNTRYGTSSQQAPDA